MAEWAVGVGSVEITPTESIWMAGYGARNKPSEGVRDPLRAKALVFRHGADPAALLVTCDLIGLDKTFGDLLLDDLTELGFDRTRVILNCSHTHGGPVLGITYPKWYGQSAETGPVARYNEQLRAALRTLAQSALDDLAPAELSWSLGSASFGMNRREFTPGGVINGVNPRAYVDRGVPVLRVTGGDGAPRAVLFGYACHNTTLVGDNYLISADYAGFAQRRVEAELSGTVALFAQGCGGDVCPHPRRTYALAERHGEALGHEVLRVLDEGRFEPIGGPLSIAYGPADLPLLPRPTQAELDRLNAGDGHDRSLAAGLAKQLEAGRPWPTHYQTRLAVWQFGDDLTLVRLPAEVVSDYVLLLERELGPLRLWITAYADDCFGYVPSARNHAEGGYEARDIITGYGHLAPSVEEVLLAATKELAAQAGRAVP